MCGYFYYGMFFLVAECGRNYFLSRPGGAGYVEGRFSTLSGFWRFRGVRPEMAAKNRHFLYYFFKRTQRTFIPLERDAPLLLLRV